jgi:nicotinamide-nucleotide amidase
MVPEICSVIDNRKGTAPGMWFEKKGKILVSMPGVPSEMKEMMEDVLAKIKGQINLPVILHRTISTAGIPESILATRIEKWENSLPPHIKLAYLPDAAKVRLRLSAYEMTDRLALQKELDEYISQLLDIIGENVFSLQDEKLEQVIGSLLVQQNQTLSAAESCTGGHVSHLITSVPGCSRYFKGSLVAYSNELKSEMLHVPNETLEKHGAVSEETVTCMASGVRSLMRTDYGIAVSGIAGPDGGTEEKPVGFVCIAVAGPGILIAKKLRLGGDREYNIRCSSILVLELLRKCILEQNKNQKT